MRTNRSRSVFAKVLLLQFLLLLVPAARTAENREIIYENTLHRLGTVAVQNQEFGDQLELAGVARTVVDFRFEYFAEFVPNGDERVRIRFYTNERSHGPYRQEPTGLLYDSGDRAIENGYQVFPLTNLNVVVPDTFTFTVEFKGLTMQPGDQAGLLMYGLPQTGKSFNEFWRRWDAGWTAFLYQLDEPGQSPTNNLYRANAGVRVTATTNTPSPAIQNVVFEPGKAIITASSFAGKHYTLEYRDSFLPGTPWRRLKTVAATGLTVQMEDISPGAGPSRFYRVLYTEPLAFKAGTVSLETAEPGITYPSVPGKIYALEYRDRFTPGSPWRHVVGSDVVAVGRRVILRDPFANGAPQRFYRVVVSDSPLQAIRPLPNKTRATITYQGVIGRVYQLEYRDGFGPGTEWKPLSAELRIKSSVFTFGDPKGMTLPMRFYRIVEKTTTIEKNAGQITVTSAAVAGQKYALEYSSDFTTWNRLPGEITAAGQTVTFTVPVETDALRVFRVVRL